MNTVEFQDTTLRYRGVLLSYTIIISSSQAERKKTISCKITPTRIKYRGIKPNQGERLTL